MLTDIRGLELAVIEAARVIEVECVGPRGRVYVNVDQLNGLADALAALDAALKPDAWQLLSEAKRHIAANRYALHKEIRAALEWKEQQND